MTDWLLEFASFIAVLVGFWLLSLAAAGLYVLFDRIWWRVSPKARRMRRQWRERRLADEAFEAQLVELSRRPYV